MFVEVLRRKTYFIVPIDGPAVEGIIAEILRVLEFDENALVVELGEVEQTHVAIAEGELQQIAGDVLGAGDVQEFAVHRIFGLELVKGLNLIKRLGPLHLLPVCHQFIPVLIKPLIHHVEGPAGELTLHGPRRDVNRGLKPLILHMEVRRVVVAEEHRDDDSVE